MTEGQYTEYVQKVFWREGDAAYLDVLPKIFDQASMRVENLIQLPGTKTMRNVVPLGTNISVLDYKKLVSVVFEPNNSSRRMHLSFATPDVFFGMQDATGYFTITGGRLRLPADQEDDVTAFVSLAIGGPLAPYFDTSPGAQDGFQSRQPAFFLHAVGCESAVWFEDDAMLAKHEQLLEKQREEVERAELYRYYGEASLAMPIPGVIV